MTCIPIRLKSRPSCCCRIICIASGPCRMATTIFQPAGGSSRAGSHGGALTNFRGIKPVSTRKSNPSGKGGFGSTGYGMKPIFEIMSNTFITIRFATDMHHFRRIGRIRAFTGMCRRENIARCGVRASILILETGRLANK